MLISIGLKNFKCFQEIEISDLKDISIITGINNIGKSTLMQAIVFLKNSMFSGSFTWIAPLHNYKETVYKHDTRKNIEIFCIFKLEKADKDRLKKISRNIDNIKYRIIINKTSSIEKEIISTSQNDEILIIDSREDDHITLKKSKFVDISSDLNMGYSSFTTAVPLNWVVSVDRENPDACIFCNDLKEILREKFQSIHYLSPNRNIPEWYSDPSKNPMDVGFNGQNTSIKLHYISSNRDTIFNEIEKWLIKFDPEIKMLRSPMIGDGKITIDLKTFLDDVNILTTGYGLNALFPIIVQAFVSNPQATILIEEPEIHLHTGAQKVIMDMFSDLINENKQIIITTHSFDILQDCYDKVRDKKIDKNKIVRWDIERKKDYSRFATKNEVYQLEWSGHGGWKEGTRHLRDRPEAKTDEKR